MRVLTQAFLDSLKARDTQFEEADSKVPGLRLCVYSSGAMSWVLRFRLDGRQQKFTIGPFPLVSLREARQRATVARGQIAKGISPTAEKKAARIAARVKAAEQAAPLDLVEDVARTFVEVYAKRQTRERSWKETQRILNHDVLPVWGKKRLSNIVKADVHRLLDGIVARGKTVLARRVLAVLKVMAAWADKRGIVETNIFAAIRMEGKPAPSRDRVLDDKEIAALLSWRRGGSSTARTSYGGSLTSASGSGRATSTNICSSAAGGRFQCRSNRSASAR
jgi:hypothetical protein